MCLGNFFVYLVCRWFALVAAASAVAAAALAQRRRRHHQHPHRHHHRRRCRHSHLYATNYRNSRLDSYFCPKLTFDYHLISVWYYRTRRNYRRDSAIWENLLVKIFRRPDAEIAQRRHAQIGTLDTIAVIRCVILIDGMFRIYFESDPQNCWSSI